MSTIDEVKQRTDIVEVITQYAALTKAGRNLRALCPFHSEKTPSFFVYPEQQSWHCFGACNTGGDVFSFIMKKQGIDFGEALRLLAERVGVAIPSKFELDARKDEKERLYKINEAAAQYFHNVLIHSPDGERARNYLVNRGLLLKTITDFRLGFSLNSWEALKKHLTEKGYTENELLEAGLMVKTEDGKTHDRFRSRLLFPINDVRGRTAGFGARVLDDSLPKYLNSPQTSVFDKSGILYGIDLAAGAIRQQNLVVIVEGYVDVITAHQSGFNNVVASMGTAVTDKQINTLKRLTKNIVLALDSDAAGEEAMLRCVVYENMLDAELKVVVLPENKDPDDVIKEDATMWQRLLDSALPVIDFTIDMTTKDLDLKTDKGQTLAVGKLLPVIAEIKDSVRTDRYLTKLSKLTEIRYNTLETALSRIRGNRKAKESKSEIIIRTLHPALSNPTEEYCLALLLQHPQLRNGSETLLPEYFENSENREIFVAWQQTSELQSLRGKIDKVIWEHLDALINKDIPTGQIEQRYADSVMRLQTRYLQNMEARKAQKLALEAERGGTVAELTKLKAEGIEGIIQLGEVFTRKSRMTKNEGEKK
ncbi:MAG: DNA primase [Dehalococcoidales bacterium]|nr:DNA primase [Dehalococcoidales bacterium]